MVRRSKRVAKRIMAAFGSLATQAEERINGKITRRVVAGEQGMIVVWRMAAGAYVGAHAHPNEQIAWMQSGVMEMRVGDETRTCRAGDFVVIPGGVEHEAWFHEDTEVVDVFAPPRADFLGSTDVAYMKGD